MRTTMTPYGVFWFFMCCTLAGIVFVYFLLPETKGKTLEDIEKIFSKKYNPDGTLKESTRTQADLEKTNEIPIDTNPGGKVKGNTDVSNQVLSNGNVLMTSEPGISNPAFDSEDEEEDDGSLATPL